MQQKHVIESINSIFNKYRQIVKQSGENYNIFKVLNVESNEVRLHSAFLADLLNSKGSHGFDSLFLRLFITELKIDDLDYQSVNVKVEQYIGKVSDISGGRIDIDISDKNGYHIIIENKK
ncbi:PD-(D/E)XK nuclease family protein [Flavobacterium sp.]|uniref:PD-(D/E)XK nuclease family protein n=1 Tax=Flavobacterium sp. TaxID=239 RepID=UPI0026054616|nr:PD-(D/E)XK nuclease family protein [Flavobacterium sp.]MDD2987292.1 PD-(D/E)XK nuclease family protein [Flavobacterium sp.]